MEVDTGGEIANAAWPSVGTAALGAEVRELILSEENLGREEWPELVNRLEPWGELPAEIEALRWEGSNLILETETSSYTCEVVRFPSSGMRARARSGDEHVDWPVGGLSMDGHDVLMVWPHEKNLVHADEVLREHISSGDLESAEEVLRRCGFALGSAHEALAGVWQGPPNSKSWNSLIAKMEEGIDSRTLWRAPFKPGMGTILSFGRVPVRSFSESPNGRIRIRPTSPGLVDAVARSKRIEWPAARDLASLLHDLGVVLHGKVDENTSSRLREAAIDGWISVQGRSRTSGAEPGRALQIVGGGLAIWEYEQALSNNLPSEATRPDRNRYSAGVLGRVPSIQRRLFTIRIFSLLSILGLMGGMACLAMGTFNQAQLTQLVGAGGLLFSLGMRVLYLTTAPRPESVFS